MPLRRLLIIALTLLPAIGTGCATSAQLADINADPLAVAIDQEQDWRNRERALNAAADRVRASELERQPFLDTLKRLVWRRGDRPALKTLAIDLFIEFDPDEAASTLALTLPTNETQWTVIEHICTLAADNQWTDLTPALVRSWARPVIEPADNDRPERAALLALHPSSTPESIVFEVFVTPTDHFLSDRIRRDAWALLCRIDTSGSTEHLLAQLPEKSADPVIADLQAGAQDLRAIPRTASQLDWLQRLRQEKHNDFWSSATSAIAQLNDNQLTGFQLRHAAAVRWAANHNPSWLRSTRADLLHRATASLKGKKHHRRTADISDAMLTPRESIDEYDQDLVWGDALLILIAIEAAQDPALAEELFNQAFLDRADRSTEHGGLIFAQYSSTSAPSFAAVPYPPRPSQRVGDNRFIASEDMIEAGADALFFFHFHVQSKNNREYAGPGKGDLTFAETQGRSCIVFTSVSKDTLNADYYQPNGARIDLGPVRNPK